MPTSNLTAELLVRSDALLGEGPFWNEEASVLDWVDIERGMLHQTHIPTSSTTTLQIGDCLASAIPRSDGGGWICGARDGLVVVGNDGEVERRVAIEADVPTNRLNDAACDAFGRLWTGSMDVHGRQHQGSLYCIDHDLRVTLVRAGMSLSNGIGWSPAGDVMYHVDSIEQTITAARFDVQTADLAEPQVIHRVDDAAPDGLAVDLDGCLWVAVWGAGQVRRLTPDGRVDAIVEVPAPQVTSVAFMGTSLAITTASIDLDDEQLEVAPLSGSVFCLDVGVEGVPVHRFGRPVSQPTRPRAVPEAPA